MPSNKDRLYIALYARGGAATMPGKEDTYERSQLLQRTTQVSSLWFANSYRYHWALLVGPKEEVETGTGMRYHAKERITGPNAITWLFEERETTLAPTSMLLVRVLIAKVEKKDRLLTGLRNTPIRQGVAGWNCVGWVQEALQTLEADGKALGTGVTDWTSVRNAAMDYCQKKKDEHRFDGTGSYDMRKVPTFDLIERKETIP